MAFPNSLKYKVLKQTNPTYNADDLLKQKLIFVGGQDIIDNAEIFIKQGLESSKAYDCKLKSTCYKNYFANICNDYNSTLFSHQLFIHPDTETDFNNKESPYNKFLNNADNCGNTLNYCLSEQLNTSFYHRMAFIGIDYPVPETKPANKAQEKQQELDKPYVYLIDTESVIDWDQDPYGNFNFIILKKIITERKSVLESRSTEKHQFKIWQKETIDNDTKITYAIYQAIITAENPLEENTEFSLIEEETVSFKQIPIVCLSLPYQLYLYGLIGTSCANLFDRYTNLLFAENQALVAIPFLSMGADFPSDDSLSDIGSNPNRKNDIKRQFIDKGFAVGGPDDKLEFVEPKGSSYSVVYTQIKEDVDQIYHIANQMGNTISQSSSFNGKQRSGQSKQLDQQAKENALSAYGYLVKQVALKLFKLASEAKGEDINWVATGLDNYSLVDRQLLISEAAQINLISIPSETFQVLYMSELAQKLLDSESPIDNEVIKNEIQKGIKEFNENLHKEELEEDDNSEEA